MMNDRDVKTIRKRAERGAKLLDRRVPGWHHRVLLTRLDMESAEFNAESNDCGCVCAQLDAMLAEEDVQGEYGYFVRQFLGWLGGSHPQVRYGFLSSRNSENSVQEYRVLTHAWKDEIRARRRGVR
jgi:hypothetical protein